MTNDAGRNLQDHNDDGQKNDNGTPTNLNYEQSDGTTSKFTIH